MNRSRDVKTVPLPLAVIILLFCAMLAILTGWQEEMRTRYPVADLPWVDMDRLSEETEKGNVSRKDAVYYRKRHAGADTTEIR